MRLDRLICRTTLSCVFIVGVLAMPSASVAAPKPVPQPLQDSVTGTGTFTSGIGEAGFDIAARSGPSGESPSGHLTFTADLFPGGRAEGIVACLRVISTTSAVIGANFPTLFQSALVGITNGTPDTLSVFNVVTNPSQPLGPGDCSVAPPNGVLTVVSGDIVITDAPPLPVSQDQCKDGGYAQFGFRNQGQCVAFVQRGPKP